MDTYLNYFYTPKTTCRREKFLNIEMKRKSNYEKKCENSTEKLSLNFVMYCKPEDLP